MGPYAHSRGLRDRTGPPQPASSPHAATTHLAPAEFGQTCPGDPSRRMLQDPSAKHQTYLPFQRAKNMYFLARPGQQKHPKSVGNVGPGPPGYRRTVLGNHWISKSGWGTGWAPLGCPGQDANFQYKIPSKGQPRNPRGQPNRSAENPVRPAYISSRDTDNYTLRKTQRQSRPQDRHLDRRRIWPRGDPET